ncbi:anthrone oxygenase family protein [Pseudorhodoplanes sinuspersici]|nr:anthrone oxygenase family protein [Pseudorhodoplanes sinuspersici]
MFQILTVLVVAIAMALTLAHALELPGKLQLSKEQYLAVQKIYYPGFTVGGAAEPVGVLLLLGLMLMFPIGSTAFWLVAAALSALAAMHLAYWLLTHPVNHFWLRDVDLAKGGSGFFSFDPLGRATDADQTDWKSLRDRWEFSHVVRAVFGIASLIFLVTAIAVHA